MMPPLDGPPFPLSLPLPHDWWGSAVLAWPGGVPFLLGQGGCALALLVEAGVGAGVGAFVGLAVGLAVGAAVGFGVGLAVGAAVGATVGFGVGLPVDVGWLGRGVDIAPGAPVGLAGAAGEAVATAIVGSGLTAPPVTVGDGEGDGAGGLGEALAAGEESVGELSGDALDSPVGAAIGVGVATMATSPGPPLPLARCCRETPPIPSAIVARTRFRTPRLRMSRAR